MPRRALTRNAADPQQVKQAGKAERRMAVRQDSELSDVLASPAGRAVLWRALEKCGVFELSYTADPYRTAFNEGERNIGLWLFAEINRVSPTAYQTMQTEAAARAQE